MKTLASCKPSEFMAQTAKIARSVGEWITVTDIQNIRSKLPHKEIPGINSTPEEIEAIEKRNREAAQKQVRENLFAIFESVFETHADETLAILALCCFVDPKDVDNYPVSAYIGAFNELINDEQVLSFFTSLARLEQTFTSKA